MSLNGNMTKIITKEVSLDDAVWNIRKRLMANMGIKIWVSPLQKLQLEKDLTNISTSLNEILQKDVREKYFLSEKAIEGMNIWEKRQNDEGRGWKQNILPEDSKENVSTLVHNVYGGFGEHKPREFEDICPTIRTPKGGGHLPMVKSGIRIRRLTPIETMRLQGFPDEWNDIKMPDGKQLSDTQKYKQAGNAVTVPVIKDIGLKILEEYQW